MKPFKLKKYFLNLKQWLKSILCKHYIVNTLEHSQTLNTTLEALRTQEKEFTDQISHKQKEIDSMESGFIKNKMQEQLDKVAEHTYGNFDKLFEKYQKL
mgnify:FL=1